MNKPKHDDKMHPNRYERAPDERSIYKRYEDASREIERLSAEVSELREWQKTNRSAIARASNAEAEVERLEKEMRAIQAATSDIAVVDITDRALCPDTDSGSRTPMEMKITPDWLRDKIKTDPDAETCEAGIPAGSSQASLSATTETAMSEMIDKTIGALPSPVPGMQTVCPKCMNQGLIECNHLSASQVVNRLYPEDQE